MRGSESIGQIFLIFYMELTYNGATNIHIWNFQKIKHGGRYGDNYRLFIAKIWKSMCCSESMGRIFCIFSLKIIYNDSTQPIFQISKKSNMAAIRGDNDR